MRFTINEDFDALGRKFEAGNSHAADVVGATEADLRRWWGAGWIEVDGWSKAPARQEAPVAVEPESVAVASSAGEG